LSRARSCSTSAIRTSTTRGASARGRLGRRAATTSSIRIKTRSSPAAKLTGRLQSKTSLGFIGAGDR
jgi:hypothetical protein